MSKFKTLLLNLVAKHLAPSEIGSLRDSFLAMDTDGSGFLTVGSPACFLHFDFQFPIDV